MSLSSPGDTGDHMVSPIAKTASPTQNRTPAVTGGTTVATAATSQLPA